MGQLIGYLIFGVITFIILRLAKGNKKKSVPQKYNTQKKNYALSDIDKMLANVEQSMENTTQPEEESNLEKYEPLEREIKEVKSHHNKNYHNDSSKQRKEAVEKSVDEEQTNFDLKSAIIYSSILKRKKFK